VKPHVLVVRLDSDGDVLVTGPAIRAVAARASRVTLLCGPRGHQAARLLPGVDRRLVHRAAWIDPEPDPIDRRIATALVDELAALGADEAVIFTSFHQSALPTALLLRMAGIRRIGAISEDYPGSLLDVRHRVDEDVHEVERALSLAAACGYELPDGDDGRLAVEHGSFPRPLEEDYVVVHPGASVPARAWPAEHHRELVDALVASGRRVVVTGSPDERDLTAVVAGPPHPDVVDLGGRTSLAQLADVLAGAAAVVVGNTGPAHLAAAVGSAVVSLFSPVVPAVRWRPWCVPHVLLGDQLAPCAGSRARECPVPGHPCLASVSPSDVLHALEQLAPVARREAVAL
jgi:ADP-heptose:LPS heptosyltransferase